MGQTIIVEKETPIRVQVFIEIEKHTNLKYEFSKTENALILDRILPYPFFYPQAYGFIPNTMAPDNDELDALIITSASHPVSLTKNQCYHAYIIGVLRMEDEKGEDNKVLCVLEEDYAHFSDISLMDEDTLEGLTWFFTNYKNKEKNKWSRVFGIDGKEEAEKIYWDSLQTSELFDIKEQE